MALIIQSINKSHLTSHSTVKKSIHKLITAQQVHGKLTIKLHHQIYKQNHWVIKKNSPTLKQRFRNY